MSNDPLSPQGASNPFSVGKPQFPYQTPPAAAPTWKVPDDQIGDGTGGLIPYKNPKALLAYYLGILSMLPLLGFPFGIASIVLGILGLKARKANPIVKGSVHAWIGIVLGASFMLIHLLIIVGIVAAVFSAGRR